MLDLKLFFANCVDEISTMARIGTTFWGADLMDKFLEAQLQATLDMIPALTWYAAPSGTLILLIENVRTTWDSQTTIRFGWASTQVHRGTLILRFCIQTITTKRAVSGQRVCAPAMPVR